jgi:hypothetical protein
MEDFIDTVDACFINGGICLPISALPAAPSCSSQPAAAQKEKKFRISESKAIPISSQPL